VRDFDTDGRVLPEEGIECILEMLFLGSLDDRGEVVFGPLSGGRKDDVSGHD